MKYKNHPKTVEQYVKLVDDTLIDVEEFIACLEFDMDEPGEQLQVLEPIAAELLKIRNGMSDGSYIFSKEDLPFMNVANKLSTSLPFTQHLAVINETHKKGLNIEDE
ncbi:MAG: hypothetical protein OEL79_06945 [Chromatiales bacterium]|nr:hypothetical protein [Chromatiales bacterium]